MRAVLVAAGAKTAHLLPVGIKVERTKRTSSCGVGIRRLMGILPFLDPCWWK